MKRLKSRQWISPFLRQCFVTAGVSLNMMNMGSVFGFSTILLPQLRKADSSIQIDDSSGSWIASLPAITNLIGIFVGPIIMGRLGRKIVNLTSITITIIGWLGVMLSPNIECFFAARVINGIGLGILLTAASAIIGEYTSPKDRGVFLATLSISIGVGVLFIHTVGSYLTWRSASMTAIGGNILTFLIVIFSPESPTFLAYKGKYDECRKVFRWLRGDNETEELEKMITTMEYVRNKNQKPKEKKTLGEKIKIKINYLRTAFTKKEFYKPVIISIHMYVMAQWSGSHILNSYTVDYIEKVAGFHLDSKIIVITLQINRLVTSVLGLIIIKKLKRRMILFTLVPLNIVVNSSIAVCSYAHDHWDFNYPWVSIAFMHLQMLTISTGTLPLCGILAGEIFPVEYKSLCNGIATVFFSLSIFLNIKTIPMAFSNIGVHGSMLVHAGIILYCMLVSAVLLPETKDRTLQDIEEEFSGRKVVVK